MMNAVALDQNHVLTSNLKHMKVVKSIIVQQMDNIVLIIIKIVINIHLLINAHGVMTDLHVILKKIFVDQNSVKILLIHYNVILLIHFVILKFVNKDSSAITITNNAII